MHFMHVTTITVNNAGEITGFDGVDADSITSLTNSGSGTITGNFDDGVDMDFGTIINSGTIPGRNGCQSHIKKGPYSGVKRGHLAC